MKQEKLIQKWLDNQLSQEELNELRQLEEYQDYKKIAETAEQFTVPAYNKAKSFQKINAAIEESKQKSSWTKQLLKVAAVAAIAFSVYFAISYNSATEIQALAGTTEHVILPDESSVELNDGSSLTYYKSKWNKNRLLKLNGEAYFEVAKGKKFTVETTAGNISVLGTKFNVKQRGDYLEVTCYEGLVKVTTPQKEIKLAAGENFQLIGNITHQKGISARKPSWLDGVSSFNSVPLEQVISELERQYNIEITLKKLTFDTDELFTGSFVHNDLKTALQSITVPFNLTYEQNNSTVILSERE
ncbi:FecR family protein [Mesonia aquimarina]|uniref:FecR family protein n=1 Tax=Mesonia aquimarina TaxID=1504967 RepID=UPI0013CEFE51|nr:FecR domain-containing protein [Mesonia aquimarina]